MGAGAGTKQETMRRSRGRILSPTEGRATGLADGWVTVAAAGAAVVVMKLKLPLGLPQASSKHLRAFSILPHSFLTLGFEASGQAR